MSKKASKLLRNRCTVRFTDEQYGKLIDYSIVSERTIGDLIRTLIDGYIPNSQSPKDIQGLIRAINRIGNNINQIVQAINTYHIATPTMINQIQNEFDSLNKLIKSEYLSEEKIDDNWYLKLE